MRGLDIASAIVIGSLIATLAISWQSEKDARLQEHENRLRDQEVLCQKLRQLERIAVSEHPAYTDTIYYPGAKTC